MLDYPEIRICMLIVFAAFTAAIISFPSVITTPSPNSAVCPEITPTRWTFIDVVLIARGQKAPFITGRGSKWCLINAFSPNQIRRCIVRSSDRRVD